MQCVTLQHLTDRMLSLFRSGGNVRSVLLQRKDHMLPLKRSHDTAKGSPSKTNGWLIQTMRTWRQPTAKLVSCKTTGNSSATKSRLYDREYESKGSLRYLLQIKLVRAVRLHA